VHRLREHTLHDFAHQRVIGNLDVADDVFLAGGHVGENRCQQVVGTHALDLRWNFLAAVKAQQGQRASGIPAPTGAENGRCECRLFENRLHRFRLKKLEDIGKRETVLLAKAMLSPLSVAAACNSKLKLRQKRLRRASPQALLIRPPKGAWMTNCIPPPSSKKRSAMIVF